MLTTPWRSTLFPRQRRSADHQGDLCLARLGCLAGIQSAKQIVRIGIQKDLVFSGAHHKPPNKTKKSIRLNPNIPLTREICADSAGYAPQALVPLYNVM